MPLFKKSPFRPAPSFTPDVLALVHETYAGAVSILEYGSGGSTLLAAELGTPVLAIESDGRWTRNMNDLLKQDFPQADAHVRHIDIGRTGKWGKPRSSRNWDRFHAYPMAVWDTLGGTQPDVILIDGRFRLACFVATVMRLTGPATILFDDYDSRDRYHIAENYQKPDQMIDRMAIFRITPRPIAPTEFGWMIPAFFYVSFTKDSH